MGAVKQHLLKDRTKECPECRGSGTVEYEVAKPHAGGFNEGYIDTEWGECDECQGSGEVVVRCEGCDEILTNMDDDDSEYCNGCLEDNQ